MSKITPFLAPRMVGPRFAEHAIPLELLKDLGVLEGMIIEVAKWCYFQDHPNRKRSPRGFTDGIAIKLFGVGDGSAVPELNLVVEEPDLFPPENQFYLEKARDHFLGAINAADYNESIDDHLPDYLLAYFDRFGRGLRDDEAIEFAPEAPERKARLTKSTRRKLVLASSKVQELTEDVTLRGSIPEADQLKMSFEIKIINGPRVVAPIARQHMQTVLDAFNGYEQGARVLLQGVGRYDRYERLQCMETVERLSLLESNDVAARMEELKALRVGWLDGKMGFAPEHAELDWFCQAFQHSYPDELPLPYLYPTAEGGIQSEWSIGGWEITLEINLHSHEAEWHALEMTSDAVEERKLDLNEPNDWRWLAAEIEKRNGGVE